MKKYEDKIIFFISLTFYLCLGVVLSLKNHPDINIYFGADNVRAYGDLIEIRGVTHYRITVHPLFLILLQPITLAVKGLVHSPHLTLIITGSIFGAICVWAVYKMLSLYINEQYTKFVLIGIYIFSYSNMIFTSIPESFIYSGAFLTLFWLYVCTNIKNQRFLSKKDYLLLIFFGIQAIGITITNYLSYTIGLILVLCICEKNIWKRIKEFLGINVFNVVLAVLLAHIQKAAWKGDTPNFLTMVFSAFNPDVTFNESYYMNFSFSLDKVEMWFKQVLVRPFISGDIKMVYASDEYTPILFADNNRWITILVFGVGILFSVVVINALKKKENLFVIFGLCVALLGNVLLHFVYGYNEAFIYSPHYLFFVIVLLGIGISSLKGIYKRIVEVVLTCFVILEACINITVFRKLIGMIVQYVGNEPYSVVNMGLKVITICGILFVVLGFAYKKYDVHNSNIQINADKISIQLVVGYTILVMISTMFIWIM